MKRPEDRIRARVKRIFNCRNLSEIARQTGFPQTTLSSWKKNPLRIRAVDLETLEDKLS